MSEARPNEYAFGTFRLLPERRLLLSGATQIRLGSRAFDLLQVLIERRGELVAKDELVSRVWPDTFVDETNLRVHIAALRRALGERGRDDAQFLVNEPGRGYRFVAPVNILAADDAPVPAITAEPIARLPTPLVRVVGREEIVAAMAVQLAHARVLSIVGPAGIGKTTVAVSLAEAAGPAYPDGVCYVDFSVADSDSAVPATVAAALGLPVHTERPTPEILAHLGGRRMLMILDGCDGVLEGAALLIEAILKAADGVHFVATTREPLRAEGEKVVRLPALTVPGEDETSSVAAIAHSAVELFVERTAATMDGFALTDAEAPLVTEICRRLDGIPLAIELAAGRVDAFGVQGVADLLGDRFRLLTGGRRRALPRHQTLAAALDWSHEMLSADQAKLFRRLGVFAGGFGLDAVVEIAAEGEPWQADAAMLVAGLVAKSLLVADVSGTITVYRLLDTIRAYSQRKLDESGEAQLVCRRHALFNLASMSRLEAQWLQQAVSDEDALFRLRLDNARAALDWCFSDGGDVDLGARLTAASAFMWMHLSLVDECRVRVQRAIDMSPRGSDEAAQRRDMRLHAALGLCVMFTEGSIAAAAALQRTLELAQTLGDADYVLRALWGLWVGKLNSGTIPQSLELARRFAAAAAASGKPFDQVVADRMMGFSLHFLGRHAEAQAAMERMLSADPGFRIASQSYRFQFDLWTTARATLAESLWIQGHADRALAAAQQAATEAAGLGHAVTTCNTLAKTSAVALHAGDLALADAMIQSLCTTAEAHALVFWRAEGRCLEGVRRIHGGDLHDGIVLLRGQLWDFPGKMLTVRYIAYLGELADALSRTDQHADAHQFIAAALSRCESNSELWCIAELLRIKGDVLARSGAEPGAVEALYRASLDWSARQGALAWQLRTALSMERFWRGTPRAAEAQTLLRTIADALPKRSPTGPSDR